LEAADSVVAESVRAYAEWRRGVKLRIRYGTSGGAEGKWVAVGSPTALEKARGTGDWGGLEVTRVVCVNTGWVEQSAVDLGVPVYSAWITAKEGAWVGLCVPDPAMAEGHEGEQVGQREGSLGRLLPGWACRTVDTGLVVSGWHPGARGEMALSGMILDPDGFLMPMDRGKNPLPPS
jgi:hypothetical protein